MSAQARLERFGEKDPYDDHADTVYKVNGL